MSKETEVRFLEIDPKALKARLAELGAEDYGEEMLEEVIFYDRELTWSKNGQFVRLRRRKGKTTLAFKKHHSQTIGGAEEIECEVSDMENMTAILEKTGLVAFRRQQKKRHTFKYRDVVLDIDTWPKIPPYVELEGPSEAALRLAAENLGLSWKDAFVEDAARVIQKYGYNVKELRYFTFERVE